MSETTELTDLVARTRSRLRQIIETLRVQDRLLLSLAELLPAESGKEDLEELAEHVELRAVILCVAKDCVRPAIEDLLAVVEEKR